MVRAKAVVLVYRRASRNAGFWVALHRESSSQQEIGVLALQAGGYSTSGFQSTSKCLHFQGTEDT